MWETKLFELWYKRKWRLISFFLLPLSAIYYLCWKALDLYYNFFNNPRDLKCPVISVGNVNIGGTGKTPFIIYLIEFFYKRNVKNIVILTRGYKAKKLGYIQDREGEPDEARLFKKRFPDIIVLANPDRYKIFVEYFSKRDLPQVVILDDGFQHRKLKRNLNIVMVDGMLNFGNGFLLPAGPLREPVNSIEKRADMVVIKNLQHETKLNFVNPTFYFNYHRLIFLDRNYKEVSINKLLNKKIIAFCGIANPDSFKNILEMNKLIVENFFVFPDHYEYTKNDLQNLISIFCDYYLTTEKDWVKISSIWPSDKPIFIVIPEFNLSNEEEFERIIYEKIHFS
ncbi:MAG: tetraacyldisaccharide 4'-kinase [Candidatus Omnitrophica bacterium]|nr:tetraacyldisaccharide 4'-kinase [Candidatus Omnitrophota bacterium]